MSRAGLVLFGLSALVSAQPASAPKPVLSVREVQVPNGLALQIDVMMSGALPRNFTQNEEAKAENYRLFLVSQPDEPEMRVNEITEQFLGTLDAGFEGSVRVNLKPGKHLDPGVTYIVTISNFDPPTTPRLSLRFKVDATIVTSDTAHQTKSLLLFSPIPVAIRDGSAIRAKRKVIKLAPGPNYAESTVAIPAHVTSGAGGNDVIVTLDKALSEGKEHQLVLTAPASDGSGLNIIANGRIKPAGAVSDSGALINVTFGGNAAVHQTGVFTLTGRVAPLHTLFLGGSTFHWDPSVTVDIGLHTTKTSNSIIFDSPFRFIKPVASAGGISGSNLPAFAAWSRSGPLSVGALEFALGPRFEVDRNFNRLDIVLEDRMDVRFLQLQRSINAVTALILKDLPKDKADLLEPINWGFELTPFIGTDQGGYLPQTVMVGKTGPSLETAGHAIFRTFAGMLGKIEYRRFSIGYDERVNWLGLRESALYKTSSGLGARNVRGWQPHSKVSINYALDSGKHYVLTATYEDGRTPPNLEYLDKVNFGLKFIY
jgi:hypothetical protein